MADQRAEGIAWTEQTWNPIRGCTRVSEGCRHCYAETVAHRWSGPGQPYEGLTTADGRWSGALRVVEDRLHDPLRWTRPRRVFVNSMSDLFHEAVSDDTLDRIFAVMALAPQHTFQILTKRPQRMLSYMEGLVRYPPGHCWAGTLRDFRTFGPSLTDVTLPLPNVWLGVSVEDQSSANCRVPLLLETPAAVRFISAEPLIGPVDLRLGGLLTRPDWLILGGESGHGARPCKVAWLEDLVRQCARAGVPPFVKQLGAYPVWAGASSSPVAPARGKNDNPAHWPEALRVRLYPAGRA